MKKIILSALLVLAATIGVQAQTQKTSVSVASAQSAAKAAEIKFDTLSHDFGIFSEKDPIVQCTFTFTNVGTAPLIIHQAIASCGCTVPTYTKDPIKPGEKGSIDVTYNGQGKFPGKFRKTITVRTNAKESAVVRLSIEGTMAEAK
ncbi:MAG: DUF1573 domain-containing protein [Bacteroidaceae bacterium]|nr:DUF1573 domain-containing protein [Bacteroidaceae bacterium]